MQRTLSLIAVVAALSMAAPSFAADAGPYKLDAAGKCRDAKGHFAKADFCKAPAAPQKCRDIKTKKFAKCGTPGTEPVPSKK